jgi:hypothetical protein
MSTMLLQFPGSAVAQKESDRFITADVVCNRYPGPFVLLG